MLFIEFPEQNEVIAKDQPQYLPIPAYYVDKSPQGEVIMKIQRTSEELLQLNTQGFFWAAVWTFDNAVQPMRFFTESPFKEIVMIPELNADTLLAKIVPGTRIGNLPYSKDQAVFVIAHFDGDQLGVVKEFTAEKKVHQWSVQHLIFLMKELSNDDQWFIVNP